MIKLSQAQSNHMHYILKTGRCAFISAYDFLGVREAVVLSHPPKYNKLAFIIKPKTY